MEEVAKRLSVTDEVEIGAGRQLHCADRLRQAILKRAFEGKLVPQDPNDEPASVLLERIRAKRVITNNIANPRRGRSMRKKATHA
jgi:type I restriction enzyme S subunit